MNKERFEIKYMIVIRGVSRSFMCALRLHLNTRLVVAWDQSTDAAMLSAVTFPCVRWERERERQ